MSDAEHGAAPGEAPGTLTALIEEVVRGAPDVAGDGAWTAGLRSGQLIGRYELLREVGRGGFGVVWEARDRDLGRIVAFKALRARGEAVRERRLLAEAEVAARLSHPNIVTVLDVGRSDFGVYLVQEFLTGFPLSKRLADGRVPVREAVRIGVELARGLAHAHAHGVIHRDLTPGNVQLCDDGQVKILDLGMAAALGRKKLEGGTPAYMAPEQAAGAPEDERTDVYALGVLLYRMLTGQAPVEVDGRGAPRSSTRGLEVPECPALATLVEAMLARSVAERPRDAGVVLAGLQEVEATLPRTAGPSRVRVRRGPRVRWMGVGAVIGLLVAGGIGVPLGVGMGPRGGAQAGGPVTLAATSAMTQCVWSEVLRTDFDGDQPPLLWRNGDFHGQEPRRLDGVPLWFQGADWNQLWVPLGATRPDVFAVEAQFLAPTTEGAPLTVGMEIFTDPVGPMSFASSDQAHGGGLAMTEGAAGPPTFGWQFPSGAKSANVTYRGALVSGFSGRWRTLRIEGSIPGRWLRATLDGQLIVAETGPRDLSGGHVCLEAATSAYRQAQVAWKHLRVYAGSGQCR